MLQSSLGDAFLEVGLIWLVLQMTGSPAAAATLLALEGLPKLMGPVAGVLVDRSSKRALMIGGDLVRGLALCGLFALHSAHLLVAWHLYVLVVVLEGVSLFYGPSATVVLPHFVDDSSLPAANSAMQAGRQLAIIVGASLAGVTLAAVGAAWALLIDGITFLLAALALTFLRFPADLVEKKRLAVRLFGRDLWEGFRYLLVRRELLALTVVLFVSNLVLSPVNVVFPLFSSQVLGQGVRGFGFLASALGLGLLFGAIAAGALGDRLPYRRAILVGLLGMGGLLWAMSFERSLGLAVPTTVAIGAMLPLVQVSLVSRLQRSVPRSLQGRVFATLGSIVALALPLGAIIVGQLLQRSAVPVFFRGAGVAVIGVAAVWVAIGLSLRRVEPAAALMAEAESSTGA
jgi:MFS family permease